MEKENNQQRQQQNDNSNKTPKRPKFNVYWIYGAILLLFIGMQFFSSMGNGAREITWKDFKNNMLQQHHVERLVVVNKQKVEVYIKPGELGRGRYKEFSEGGFSSGPQYYFTIGSVEYFEKQMDEAQQDFSEEQRISPQYETREDHIGNLIGWLLPIAIIVAIWIFIMRRMTGGGAGGGGQIFNIGKSKAKLFDREGSKVKVDFSNVAGLSEAKVEVKEIVDFLKKPERYTELGGKIPKGALLIGPPGTGKTLLAKAVAGEAEVPFFSISGSDFVEMFVGVGASRVRDLFKKAKKSAPCIVFIDEIDAVGRRRGSGLGGSHDEREQTLNQILVEMDGFDSDANIIIIAATNRPDVLDPALLRPGRFDRRIILDMPDINDREEI